MAVNWQTSVRFYDNLLVLHNGQIIVGCDIKCLQHHIQHLPMLTSYTYYSLMCVPLLQFINKRAHFDCFRSGTENEHYYFHFTSPTLIPHICASIGTLGKMHLQRTKLIAKSQSQIEPTITKGFLIFRIEHKIIRIIVNRYPLNK